MTNVRIFTGESAGEMDPDAMLETAKGHLESVIIIGKDKNGKFFISSSHEEPKDITFALQRGIHDMMEYASYQDQEDF